MPSGVEAQPVPSISPLAGQPAPKEMLVDLARLDREYFERRPDVRDPDQMVSFGTSGHRGSPLRGTFTEAHILAITQAICDYRGGCGTDGPLYMGKDTHAVSDLAQRTALEVLAANNVATVIQRDNGVTPTPVISRAILVYNRGRKEHLANGIVITPSHNPPEDGGFKYNPSNGGPADTDVTQWVEERANALLRGGNAGVKRVPFATAMRAASTHQDDFVLPYVNDLRHGIVTPAAGLIHPNHYLAVAIRYLLTHRPHWPAQAAVGKTLVSSSMIDRVVHQLGRRLYEVPVGFKWFVPGLFDGTCCFGGEESAGASFLRHDGTVWTTDKDGPIMDLLAAEITARTDRDPGEHYRELVAEFGASYYTRVDAPATPEQKARLQKLSPEAVRAETLAGERITARLTRAPGNDAAIGGLKIVTTSGWFAARPSGTENIYKIYAESFRGAAHLDALVSEAQELVDTALGGRA